MRMRFALLVVVALMAHSTSWATNVCGDVSGVWDMTGSPYLVTCDANVPVGQTLAIQAGVQVLFTGHYRFTVNGNLQAIGAPGDSILFSRAVANDQSKWWGIRFVPGSSDSSKMDYCIIEWVTKPAGSDWDSDGGGIWCSTASPRITRCTLRNNVTSRGGGVYLLLSQATVERCVIYGNSAIFGGGIFCTSGSPTIDRCTVTGNTASNSGQQIYSNGTSISSTIVSYSNGTGSYGNVEYRYCDFYGNSGGDGGGESGFGVITSVNSNGDPCDQYHNIFLDPLYVDRIGGDFRLSLSSHCVDAGDPALPHDPDGSMADIGALPATLVHGIHVSSPNGGELWHVSQVDTIRWSGVGFQGGVRIELNRDYPNGPWELLADNIANNGQEPWSVDGLASSNCRIRVSAVADTFSDVSDGSFTISSALTLLVPNGGENWGVFQTDTVRWVGGGLEAVRLELNHNYPDGPWEVLKDSTANDGEEAVFVTDPLSTHCRIRVLAYDDTLTDISDSNFTISSSQGYLALVRTSAPDIALVNWNAGTIECPQVATETFRLKNFGSQVIVAFQPLEPVSSQFSRSTSCGTFFAMGPGQMSACSLRLSFDPSSDRAWLDTLLIQTDAINAINGYVRIPLSGAQISTPAPPQVVIQPAGEDVHLAWNTVTQSVGGCPVAVTRYLVFYSPTPGGPFYYHGYTTGTSYTHVGAVPYAGGMFYQVIAWTGSPPLLDTIPRGEKMETVMEELNTR